MVCILSVKQMYKKSLIFKITALTTNINECTGECLISIGT